MHTLDWQIAIIIATLLALIGLSYLYDFVRSDGGKYLRDQAHDRRWEQIMRTRAEIEQDVI